MTTAVPVLPVIFRIYRKELCAYFPTEHWNSSGTIACYAHIGQHSGASREWLSKGRRAKPNEYAELLAELQGIYERPDDPDRVQLKVYQRAVGKASYFAR